MGGGGGNDSQNVGPKHTTNHILFIFVSRLCTEPAGLSHKEQVGSTSLTSSHYQHGSQSERGKPPGMGRKTYFKDLQNPSFYPHSLSIPCCHHFILPLPASFWGEVGERGWIVYLALICSVVSFGEMTCNLRGKGQFFFIFCSLLRANLQPLGGF